MAAQTRSLGLDEQRPGGDRFPTEEAPRDDRRYWMSIPGRAMHICALLPHSFGDINAYLCTCVHKCTDCSSALSVCLRS
jgi:hypothetical protein